MNRRSFIKALTLVPVILGVGKITFQQEIKEKNYKHYFYGGNAGGGKTEMLNWNPTPAQKRFFETPLEKKYIFLGARR